MTEFELFQALRPLYPEREYALLPQVANGTGAGAFRHCDALALSLWPSRGMHLHGFEIKSYRGDWLREMKHPEKAEEISAFCNYWWIVAAGLFVKPDELPQPWGLMVWDGKKLVKEKPAPYKQAEHPDFSFVAAMLRKAQDVVTPVAALEAARAEGYEAGQKMAKANRAFEMENLQKLSQKVKEFEIASGIQIVGGWHGGAEIGAVVQQVLAGTLMRERQTLLATAKRIVKDLEGDLEAVV